MFNFLLTEHKKNQTSVQQADKKQIVSASVG